MRKGNFALSYAFANSKQTLTRKNEIILKYINKFEKPITDLNLCRLIQIRIRNDTFFRVTCTRA